MDESYSPFVNYPTRFVYHQFVFRTSPSIEQRTVDLREENNYVQPTT
jgi:hypothetical protein